MQATKQCLKCNSEIITPDGASRCVHTFRLAKEPCNEFELGIGSVWTPAIIAYPKAKKRTSSVRKRK